MADIKPGKASFLHTNMILDTDAGITATTQASGVASRPQKEGAGAASAILGGTYSGTNNLDYYIEIQTTGEIGVATFRWSQDGGATFVASGVATSASPVSLNNGVTVQWTSGAGNDVVAADTWRFKGYLPYHRRNVLDRDRDTEWRSTGLTSQMLTFDLGSAQQPMALAVLDHNLTSAASITLQGSAGAGFGSPTTYVIPWQSGKLLYFLSAPFPLFQYWRLVMSDAANPDGYLRISEVFLGGYTRLDRTFDLGDFRGKVRAGQRDRTLSGKFYGAVNAVLRVFDLSWIRLSQTERDLILLTVFDALNDIENRQVLPVFFSPMDTDLSQIYLCEWQDQQAIGASETDAPERYSVPVRLVETPRTLALTSS
jgi:hypothetical protein